MLFSYHIPNDNLYNHSVIFAENLFFVGSNGRVSVKSKLDPDNKYFEDERRYIELLIEKNRGEAFGKKSYKIKGKCKGKGFFAVKDNKKEQVEINDYDSDGMDLDDVRIAGWLGEKLSNYSWKLIENDVREPWKVDIGIKGRIKYEDGISISGDTENIENLLIGISGEGDYDFLFKKIRGEHILKIKKHVERKSGGGVVRDTTPPVIEILSPQNKTYNTSSIPLEVSINERVKWANYTLDDVVSGSIYNTTLSNLTEGPHVLRVEAEDLAGNKGSSEVHFEVDVTPPVVKLFLPEENKTYWNDVPLNITVNEPAELFYSVNGSKIKFGGNTTLSLPKGNYTLKVYARDRAGNTGMDSVNISVKDVYDLINETYQNRYYKTDRWGEVTWDVFINHYITPEEVEVLKKLQNYRENPINIILSQVDEFSGTDFLKNETAKRFIDFMHNTTEIKEENESIKELYDFKAFINQPWRLQNDRGDLAWYVWKKFDTNSGNQLIKYPKAFLSVIGTWGPVHEFRTTIGTSPELMKELAYQWLKYQIETEERRDEIGYPNKIEEYPFTVLQYLMFRKQGLVLILRTRT